MWMRMRRMGLKRMTRRIQAAWTSCFVQDSGAATSIQSLGMSHFEIEVTEQEWMKTSIQGLGVNHFIKVGNDYFQPAVQATTERNHPELGLGGSEIQVDKDLKEHLDYAKMKFRRGEALARLMRERRSRRQTSSLIVRGVLHFNVLVMLASMLVFQPNRGYHTVRAACAVNSPSKPSCPFDSH